MISYRSLPRVRSHRCGGNAADHEFGPGGNTASGTRTAQHVDACLPKLIMRIFSRYRTGFSERDPGAFSKVNTLRKEGLIPALEVVRQT